MKEARKKLKILKTIIKEDNIVQMTIGCIITMLSLYTLIIVFPLPHASFISFLSGTVFAFGSYLILKCISPSRVTDEFECFLITESFENESYELWVLLSNGYYKCLLKDDSKERIEKRMISFIDAERTACVFGSNGNACKTIHTYDSFGKKMRIIKPTKEDVDVEKSTNSKTGEHLGVVRKKIV